MKSLPLLAALGLLAPTALFAQTSPFTGKWKGDVKSAKLPTRPERYLLKDGTYHCLSCVPAVTVAVDGQFHPVPGQDYYDQMRVTIVSPTRVSYASRLRGKDVSEASDTVSADGRTLTSSWRAMDAANGTPTEGAVTMTRVAAAPAGAHAISGDWRRASVESISDAALSMTIEDTGQGLKMSAGTGESYHATYGGPAVPITGDPAGTMVKVERVNATTVLETGMRGGKPVYSYRMQLAPDGKSMTVVSTNKKTGNETTFVAYKQ